MSEPSDNYSCKMKALWDFATSANTGKHTEGREVYRYNSRRLSNAGDIEDDYGFSVIETRNKVRGSGKALVLRFEATDDRDFELLGWGMEMTATTKG